MEIPVLAPVDAAVGNAVEAAVRLKHRRRLARLGWARALDPARDGSPFASGEPPPRPGNAVEVLIDGAQALPALAHALREARRYVRLTGWHLEPSFELLRGDDGHGGDGLSIGALLGELAARGVDVRVLVWAGAPLPAIHPTRSEVREVVERLTRQTGIRCEIDPREHPVHCHHEKTVVIDGELAFVGGIDLTDSAGDRYDSSDHPARRRLGWHDVATALRGPVVADVDAHFAQRWRAVAGERLPVADPPVAAGDSTVQLVRTVAEDMYEEIPRGDFRILESYVRALRGAERLIYLENQFLWSPELVELLADKLRNPPRDDFRIVILLPSRANNGHDDTRGQLGLLTVADDEAGGPERMLAATIQARSGDRADRIYVHAKVGVVDDRWLTVGSANLNAHSLMNDTEVNVVSDDPELARATRERLWAEHLELPLDEVRGADPARLVDERWRPIAFAERERREREQPPTHRLLALPGVSHRSARLLGPLQGIFDDG